MIFPRDRTSKACAPAIGFSVVPGGDQSLSDPTPFHTRTRLLTTYAPEVQAVREGRDPFPVALEVNVNNTCDQHCGWCINGNVREPRQLDVRKESFTRFLEDFKRLGGRALTWTGGGEPTLHPDLTEAMALASRIGLPQGLITHGAFDPKLVDPIANHSQWVRISVDTHDPDAYRSRRGTNHQTFSRVIDNARALAARGARVGLNMNVSDWNRDHIEPLYHLASDIGASYLQVRPTLRTPFDGRLHDEYVDPSSIPEILETIDRLRTKHSNHPGEPELVASLDKFGDLQKPASGRNGDQWGYVGCHSHRLFVVLNANGDLMVCMYHLFDDRFIFGNMLRNTLEEIWLSESRKRVLSFCKKDLNHERHGCQVCCKGHEINKVLSKDWPTVKGFQNDRSPFI